MELIKKNIHMNRLKSRILSQLTLDDDFIVPDVKADIDDVITSEGEVIIDSLRTTEGKINVKGRFLFKLLYLCNTGERRLHNMEGALSFDENFLMDGVRDGDNVNVKWDIEDLSIGIINTRKISVRAAVMIEAVAEEIYDVKTAVAIGEMEEGRADCLKRSAQLSQMAVSKRDILRVREELDIPSNKGNIYNILWSTVRLKNTSTRVLDGKVGVSGEVSVVVLYEVEEENAPVQWIDTVIPFSGAVEADCIQGMISDIEINIASANISSKPDTDGEPRLIELDMIVELGVKIYNEETVEYISDIYSTCCHLEPMTETVTYNTILIKNQSKSKVSDKLKLDGSTGNVMQIFGSDGTVKIDDIRVNVGGGVTEDVEGDIGKGIVIEGIVSVNIMYISSDDSRPISVAKEIIPFTHEIEAPGITADSLVFIRPSLEQLTTVMVGNNEIEAKAVAVFDTLVFNCITEEIILDVVEKPLDIERVKAIPCMAGYNVKKGDTLWKIAKKYYTTVDSIRKVNDIKGTDVQEGDMLLVVKEGM